MSFQNGDWTINDWTISEFWCNDLENLTENWLLDKDLRNHTKLFNSRQRFGIILSPLQAVNLVIVIVENKMFPWL